MKHQIDSDFIRNLVQNHIQEVKTKNPHYSLRAFSRRMGVSAGGLSMFLSGKKKCSSKLMEKIVQLIVSDPEERMRILSGYNRHIMQELKNQAEIKPSLFRKLSESEFDSIRDWYHFAILYLTYTTDFRLDYPWIGSRLGIDSKTAEEAITRMVSLGILSFHPDGTLNHREETIKTSDEVSNQSIKIMHRQILEKVSDGTDLPTDIRDITSVTLPIHTQKIPKAKELIRKFHEDLIHLLGTEPMNEVYNVMIAMVPLSKRSPDQDIK